MQISRNRKTMKAVKLNFSTIYLNEKKVVFAKSRYWFKLIDKIQGSIFYCHSEKNISVLLKKSSKVD